MKTSRLSISTICGLCLLCGGCYETHYVTPASQSTTVLQKGPLLTLHTENTEPAAVFPATVAIARIQSYPHVREGQPSYRIVGVREPETELIAEALNLPGLTRMVPVSDLLVTGNQGQADALRRAAVILKADLLLVYSVHQSRRSQDWSSPVSLASLGMAPTVKVKVTTTVSGMLIDAHTGYLYGVVESTQTKEQTAAFLTRVNAWDQCAEITEKKAMEGMTVQFKQMWHDMYEKYNQEIHPNSLAQAN